MPSVTDEHGGYGYNEQDEDDDGFSFDGLEEELAAVEAAAGGISGDRRSPSPHRTHSGSVAGFGVNSSNSSSTRASGSGSPSLEQRRSVAFRLNPASNTPVPVVLVQDGASGSITAGHITGSSAYVSGGGGAPHESGGLSGTGSLDISAMGGAGGAGGTDIVIMGNLIKAGGVMGNAWRRRWCVLRRFKTPVLLSAEAAAASANSGAGKGAITGSAALQVPLGCIYYFASSRDAAPRGAIMLSLAALQRTRVTWPPGHPAGAALASALAALASRGGGTSGSAAGGSPDVDDHDVDEEGDGAAADAAGARGSKASSGINTGTAGSRDRPFTIALRARGRRFFLQAADEGDLRRWLAALAALVPPNSGLEAPPQLCPPPP